MEGPIEGKYSMERQNTRQVSKIVSCRKYCDQKNQDRWEQDGEPHQTSQLIEDPKRNPSVNVIKWIS